MTDDDLFEQHIALLERHQQQTEFKFVSGVPIVGPLISYFRSIWLSMAAQWYVRHYVQQQQAYNQAVLDTLRLLSAQSKHRHEQVMQTQLTIQQSIEQTQDQIKYMQKHVDFIQQTQEKDFETIAQTLNKDYDNG